MNYYRIEHSINEQEVGRTFPQSHTARQELHLDDPRNLSKQELGKLLLDVFIPEPVLHSNAVLTDLVSTVNLGTRLVISQRLKQLLEQYQNKGDCEFLPILVHHINITSKYWLLNPVIFRMDIVNFELSAIWSTELGFRKLNRTRINDYPDFLTMVNSTVWPKGIMIEKVVLMEDSGFDFVILRYVDGGIGYYVSETLRDEIKKAGCTGLGFTKTL